MTHSHTCIAPICLRLEASPWQQLPEMSASRMAERAGIEAGLGVLELFHLHYATLPPHESKRENRRAHRHAFHAALQLRVDIVEALK